MDKRQATIILKQILDRFNTRASNEVESTIQNLHFLYSEVVDPELQVIIKEYIDRFEASSMGDSVEDSETSAYMGANFTPDEVDHIKRALGKYIDTEDDNNVTSIFKNKE